MKLPSIHTIVETIFTTPNPETGSLPPKHTGWVIFQNDTVCIIDLEDSSSSVSTTFEELSEIAIEKLKQLNELNSKTTFGDFNVSKVSWFPKHYIYLITYPSSKNILNFIIENEEVDELTAGIEGSLDNGADAKSLKIKLIRNFEGKIHRP